MKEEIKQQIEGEIKKESFEIDSLAEYIFKKGIEKGYKLAEKQSDAVEFAKWIKENSYESYDFRWKKKYDYISNSIDTEQLYEIFKQSKTK
jgi:hypothetical protein